MTTTIPRHWQTARCWVRDAQADDASVLTQVYNSCSHLASVDPTFGIFDEGELADLIATSVSGAGAFRLQVFGLNGAATPLGYYHLTHGHPQPTTVWLSMFVVGARHHGRGIGSEVASGLLGEVGRLDWCAAVWLKVYVGNVVALRHWAGVGFRQIVEVRVPAADNAADTPSMILASAVRSQQGPSN